MPGFLADEVAALRHVAYTAAAFVAGTTDHTALASAVALWTQARERLSKTSVRHSPPRGGEGGGVFSSELPLPRTSITATEGKTKTVSRGVWLAPYGVAWEQRYGGTPPWGQLGRALKPVHETLGDEEGLARWKRYLAKTPATYASPWRFASTVGEWAEGKAPDRPRAWDEPQPGEDVDAYIRRMATPEHRDRR